MYVDFSIPRKCIYRYIEDDPGPCPNCGSTLQHRMATYLVLTRSGDEQGDSFITNIDGGWFCPQCPTLLLDLSEIREGLSVGLPDWKIGEEFTVAGIVDLDAIPEDKMHLPLDHPDNPLPLVEFTEIIDDALPEIKQDQRDEEEKESLFQRWRRRITGAGVKNDIDHTMIETDYPEPVSKLLNMGEPEIHEWRDYLALGLGPEHVPDLIRMAVDEPLYKSAPKDSAGWAPVHAWRALSQLRPEEAIEPLTQLLEYSDDWVSEEIPTVFARIGPAAIPVLEDYLNDTSHGSFARIVAISSLYEIAEMHPQARSGCVEILVTALERFETFDPYTNGFLISYLTDLGAVEAAPLMERAFEAGRVNPMVMGDWEDVQVELGLLEERTTPRPSLFGGLMDRLSGMEDILNPESEARRRLREIGRNDPCWCGSGKKYKHCHLREDQQKARE